MSKESGEACSKAWPNAPSDSFFSSKLVTRAFTVGSTALEPPDHPELWDSSHGPDHLKRVMRNVVRIGTSLGASPRAIEIAVVGAALHDFADSKLLRPGETKNDALVELDRIFLIPAVRHGHMLDFEAKKVREIVRRTGYSVMRREMLESGGVGLETFLELNLVRDADLLDSVGAIGVTRCVQFGTSRNRRLRTSDVRLSAWESDPKNAHPEPFAEVSPNSPPGGTVEHFFEKLLRVGSVLATEPARAIARPRIEFMKTYLRQLDLEEDNLG